MNDTALKFCKDCKHIGLSDLNSEKTKYFYSKCHAPAILEQRIDLITGVRLEPPSCNTMRGELRLLEHDQRILCGREARYFQTINSNNYAQHTG